MKTILQVPFVDLRAQYASLRQDMDAAVLAVLQSASFVGGPVLEKFEREFAAFCGARHAIGVANGTDAITLAVRAAGLQPGDEVLVPANSFFASAEAISNAGATPVFVDVDPQTFHMCPTLTERAITPRTRAILPVHLYGRAMNIRPFLALAERHGLVIIEDCAQAHGASFAGERIGSSGRLTCYSFYPGKNLGAYGDAGAITTSDDGIALKLRTLRDHGSSAKYTHDLIGWNSRLDALQAAVLSVKLPHLAAWNSARNAHARYLAQALAGCATLAPEIPQAAEEHVFHLFVVRSTERDSLRMHLAENGIQTAIHYPVPLHLTGAYSKGSHSALPLTSVETLSSQILSLPMFPELTETQLEHIVDSVRIFEQLSRPAHIDLLTNIH